MVISAQKRDFASLVHKKRFFRISIKTERSVAITTDRSVYF